MNGFIDIYTIIFLALAIVVFLRLRSVLGRRTGHERPPFDPYSRREAERPDGGDKVITLPQRGSVPAEAQPAPQTEVQARIRTLAPDGSPLAGGLTALAAADRSFDPDGFLAGARQAYEMIVSAFAEGDRKTLKQLLSREVYDGFVAAIAEREQRRETVDFNFVGIDKAELIDAAVRGGVAQVTVRFVSSLISATKNAEGEVVDGDPTHVAEVTDVWTFSRDIASRDPNWKLAATESVE